MNSRLFLYSGLFLVLILLYDSWHNRPGQNVVTQKSIPETIQESGQIKSEPSSQPNDELPEKKGGNVDSILVVTNTLELKISLADGSIISSKLLKYPESFGSDEIKVQLLDDSNQAYVARVGLQSKSATQPQNFRSSKKEYLLEDRDNITVEINGETNEGVKITKKYLFERDSHLINISQVVQNTSNAETNWRQYYTLERGDEQSSNAMLYTYTGAAFYDDDEKFSKISFSDIEDNDFLRTTSNSWISMIEHYFFTAWLPSKNEKQTIYTRFSDAGPNKSYLIGSVGNYKSLPAGSKKVFASRLYVGPKNQSEIKDLAPGLDLTVDYGMLTFLAAPLFWILDKIYFLFGNWGWSIIALTFIIKLVFFRLSETSYKSMAKMKKLTPRMTALKERYGEDRKKFSEELMKIYKEEKVNPLGGCLPILIQIPVFIALYWVIIESVEMRHAPFIGWILDLSSADPFYILPILMGISMYIQQKLNPPPTDAMQQKIFLALPFIFTFLFATFPSGLVLYWLTNNVLSIAQQYVINKRTLA